MITLNEFSYLMKPIKEYSTEVDSFNDAFSIIAEGGRITLGYKLLDAYIEMLERLMGFESNEISWFVYENDFGSAKKRLCGHKIKSEKDLYNYIKESHE